MKSGTYIINSPPVTHQTIDGEVVIINLQNGSYYSLRDSAAMIWALVEQGAHIDGIIGFIRENYTANPEGGDAEMQNSVIAFLDALRDEQLIAEVPHNGGVETQPPALSAPYPAGGVFRRPEFDKYSDLQDLVMLDPIHQVSEQGWPHPKEDE